MRHTMTATEGWLLARGWIWAKDRYYGESWQKGDHVAATAAGARDYEERVLVQFPRQPTQRGMRQAQQR